MNDANAHFATLATGDGAWLRFTSPTRRETADNAAALPAWWSRLNAPAQPNAWRVVYVGFEAAVIGMGLQPPARRPGPLAAMWTCPPPRPCAPPLPAAPCAWAPEWDAASHGEAVARLVDAITAGEIYQANLTFRMHGRPTDPAATTAHVSAPPWAAVLYDPELTLWSRSPECFLRFDLAARTVATEPIKGTAASGEFAALAASPKERAEHIMIVDMARNDLGKIATPGSVRVDTMFAPLEIGYAVHAVSIVCAELRPKLNAASLLQAMLPAASVSGTPKRRACAWIGALEPSPRGPYTGVLGWIAPEGRGAFSVLIRTVWRDHAGWAYGTGGGVVADSDPAGEYAEALLKTRALAATP